MSKISLLALLLSSKEHHNALLKVLNHAYVPQDIFIDKLDRLVNNIIANNFISFSDDEIPSGAALQQKLSISQLTVKGLFCLKDLLTMD